MSLKSYQIAGKVFLLGEYAVLGDLPAMVAAVGPRFRLKTGVEPVASRPFHPESPAGLLWKWATQMVPAEKLGLSFQFEDPHQGEGGFGASTAQFSLLYLALACSENWISQGGPELSRRWEAVWKLYRELTAGGAFPPSGADLVAQWRGGVSFFDPSDLHCLDVWPLMGWENLLVFSASHRKVPTHSHLKTLLTTRPGAWLKSLETSLLRGIAAVQDGNWAEFAESTRQYANVLWQAELELPEAREDRIYLDRLPGVLAAKGCGALLADTLIVLLEPRTLHRAAVIAEAQSRGLKLIADGLPSELGVGQ